MLSGEAPTVNENPSAILLVTASCTTPPGSPRWFSGLCSIGKGTVEARRQVWRKKD